MVLHVPDKTGRFSQRPHYKPAELDGECESIIAAFLRDLYGEVSFPVSTDDLTKLIERDAEDLDLYADLFKFGPTVEGLTKFCPGHKPRVMIAQELSEDERRENRLRTTLTHEYGHVHFHAYLWELEPPGSDLFNNQRHNNQEICRRETILDVPQADWMEWQAGYVCGALLMPASYVKRLIGDYQNEHGIYGPVRAETLHGQALITALIEAFQVSSDAARIRLLKLGIIDTHDRGPSLFS